MGHEHGVAPARRGLPRRGRGDRSGAPGRGRADVVAVLVPFVARVQDGRSAVRRHPGPVVDRHERWNNRPVNVLDHVRRPQPAHRPTGEAVVHDLRVDEIEVIAVIESDVALVAHVELVRRRREVGKPRHVDEVHAVCRGPHPGLRPDAVRRAGVESDGVAVVLLVRRDEDVSVPVERDARLVAAA